MKTAPVLGGSNLSDPFTNRIISFESSFSPMYVKIVYRAEELLVVLGRMTINFLI